MKVSTKGRYGLRALIDLAIHSTETHQSLVSIAERQSISEIYLEQVFATLRKAGLVKSIKGAQGGYLLSESPDMVKVGAILRALEGDLSVMDEQVANEKNMKSISYCVKVNVWDKIDLSVNRLVDSLTLEDLVNEYRRINADENLMYFI